MISLLHARFSKIMDAPQESDLRQNAIKYGLIDQAGKCPYLSWHKEQRKLVASKSPALTMEDTMEMLTIIKNNMEDPRVTLRFHSLQKLQEDHSRAVPFLVDGVEQNPLRSLARPAEIIASLKACNSYRPAYAQAIFREVL